ncbi:tyrosine-type recombinase/integrase [Amnibacterium sp.]|jgi:hypothetical protein|uniref:tyrosine-type recombinase/integrase n=1 Tax=Amnibacterium sp. TaxID=1872496 RepID=UPI0039C86F6D
MTVHDLRHTAASLAVAAQANLKAVQHMLGHASAAMTLDICSDLFDDDLDGVATAAEQVRRRRDAERSRARAARFTVRLQRLEQRWAALAVRQQREAERRLRTEIHPAGISLERALQRVVVCSRCAQSCRAAGSSGHPDDSKTPETCGTWLLNNRSGPPKSPPGIR